MRILRSTHWSPDLEPTVMVVRECDLVEGGIDELLKPQPGVFTTNDLFEVDDVNQLDAVFQASNRVDEEQIQRERNMAMLYYYNLFSPQAEMTNEGGVIFQSRPSPFSVADIKKVFEQIAISPTFKARPLNMMALSENMQMVLLKSDGTIKED